MPIYIYFLILLGNVCIHFNNIYAQKHFDATNPLKSVIIIALTVIPLTLIGNITYMYFYGQGKLHSVSFVVLTLLATGSYILMSFLIQFFYFQQNLSLKDVLVITFVLIGFLIQILMK